MILLNDSVSYSALAEFVIITSEMDEETCCKAWLERDLRALFAIPLANRSVDV